MTATISRQITVARLKGVPILAIQTPDPAATVQMAIAAIQGAYAIEEKQDSNAIDPGLIAWDFASGVNALNDKGSSDMAKAMQPDSFQVDPFSMLNAAQNLPAGIVLFVYQGNRILEQPAVTQAVWNLRDKFKANGRTLILLGSDFKLPPELQGDVIVLDEPLPAEKQLAEIIKERYAESELPEPNEKELAKAVAAVQGIKAFAAEQAASVTLGAKGLDFHALWEEKRKMIETTPGLTVYRGSETFDDLGGLDVIKSYLLRVMKGNAPPNAMVFVDEIEKVMAGSKGDTSGVSQDQLGCLLSYMQDHQAAGMIFLGPPGSGKSAVAKAAGAAGGIPTIQLDLGAAKGSLVGQSESQLRQALKVITAVSNNKSLWIATCNSITDLPPELRRRFTLGSFFFDLPTPEERSGIWKNWLAKFTSVKDDGLPNHEGWTGAEIRQCVETAWRLDCSLKEAAEFIVPVSRSAADKIDALRNMADGRFLSASYSGIFRVNKKDDTKPVKARRMVKEGVGILTVEYGERVFKAHLAHTEAPACAMIRLTGCYAILRWINNSSPGRKICSGE